MILVLNIDSTTTSTAMESISSRVLIWTVVEALVLVGVAYWQVRLTVPVHKMDACRSGVG